MSIRVLVEYFEALLQGSFDAGVKIARVYQSLKCIPAHAVHVPLVSVEDEHFHVERAGFYRLQRLPNPVS